MCWGLLESVFSTIVSWFFTLCNMTWGVMISLALQVWSSLIVGSGLTMLEVVVIAVFFFTYGLWIGLPNRRQRLVLKKYEKEWRRPVTPIKSLNDLLKPEPKAPIEEEVENSGK